MAAQLLVEMASSSGDAKLIYQIFHSVLFDFRIWSRSEFHVQIGHIQYLSTLIKEDRKYFKRKGFGAQYFLDVIRNHYSSESASGLSAEDKRTVRASLLGLVRIFLLKDVTSKDVIPIVNFLLSVKDSDLLTELVDMVSHYLLAKTAKDQMFLVMHESKRTDLVYCLLLDEGVCSEETNLR